jgi:hypothetical protein
MADNNLTLYGNFYAGNAQNHIVTPIVQHLNAKGVSVTVEELMGVLQLPVARSAIPAITPFGGGVVPPMASAVGGVGAARKNTAVASAIPGKTCRYEYQRGENRGKCCGKPTTNGQDYCNCCQKNRKSLSKTTAAGAIPGIAPGIPGMSGYPQAQPQQQKSDQLDVEPYDQSQQLYREINNNFLVKDLGGGNIVALGCFNETRDKINPLTPQQQAIAVQMRLQLLGPDGQVITQQTPTAPVPSFPSAIPMSIPSAVPSVIPSAVPSVIPSVPVAIPSALPIMTPAAIPSVVPAMPTGFTSGPPMISGFSSAIPQLPGVLPTAGQPTLPSVTPLGAEAPQVLA